MEILFNVFVVLISLFLISLGSFLILKPREYRDFSVKISKLKEGTLLYQLIMSNSLLICYRICGVIGIIMGIVAFLFLIMINYKY
jgi:hypothetical protein